MKLVWLSTLVLGATTLVVVRATEEETDTLQNLQQGRQNAGAIVGTVADTVTSVAADPLSSVLLTIGNVAQALNGGGGLGGLGNLGNLGGLAGGAAGGAAALGTGLAAASSLKSAILGIILKPLDFVNGILAIIALALLIAYLVSSEGDIKGLVGGTGQYRREGNDFGYDTYSNYINTARSLWNDPIVQRLTTAVQDAIIKYDE